MTDRTTAAKLQIKDGHAVYFAGRDDASALVGELPEGAHPTLEAGSADAAVIFVADSAALDAAIPSFRALAGARAVWVCYPKGNAADINRDSIRDRLALADWEIVSNVSVDATWSALRAKYVS